MSTENEVKILESNTSMSVFEAQERASIDVQVSTAKRYPRDLKLVRNNSIVIVTMDIETAKACRYAKPVAGKVISGASVHLARIICQQYGNIRIQQRIKEIGERTIVAEAVAFDLETNYAVCVEARRSIWSKKNNKRFEESVVETNAMAILAIAERNAILKVVPKSIIDNVYNAAFNMVNGDLSDEQKLLKARSKAVSYCKEKYEATEDEICKAVGTKSIAGIGREQIIDLRGFLQSITDKELTADELFQRKIETETVDPFKKDAKKPAEKTETETTGNELNLK